jgi:hypothetical protein
MDRKSFRREVFSWGWLRLLLDIFQMTCAASGTGVLVTNGRSMIAFKVLFALKYDKIAGQIDL